MYRPSRPQDLPYIFKGSSTYRHINLIIRRPYIAHTVDISCLSSTQRSYVVHISSMHRPYILHRSCRQYISSIYRPDIAHIVKVKLSPIHRPYHLYIAHRSPSCRPNYRPQIVGESSVYRMYRPLVTPTHMSSKCRPYIDRISSRHRHIASMYQSETRSRGDPGGGWVGMPAPQRNRERAKRYVGGDDVVHASPMY